MKRFKIKWVSDYPNDFASKNVFLRASLNVPIDDGKVADSFRLQSTLQTINFLRNQTKVLAIIGHIGRESTDSLHPVYKYLKKQIPELKFVPKEKYFDKLPPGIYLFENLRQFDGETECDEVFAGRLSSNFDLFVQDAFAVLHRPHASVVLLPKFMPSYAGFLVQKEIENLKKALIPPDDSAFILGGAKFETKEKLIGKMLDKYKKVLIVGAIANDFLKGRGLNVGASKVGGVPIPQEILNHPHLILPEKYTIIKDGKIRKSNGKDIKDGEVISDAFMPLGFLSGVNFLLWNGPFGWYEKGFTQGTASLFTQLEIFKPEAIAGGGDSNAIIDELDAADLFTFRSTAGGAMLEFLENETLPGLQALSTNV